MNLVENRLFTATQVASCIGISSQAARKALLGTPADGARIIRGVEAAAWSMDRLPESLRKRLAEQARRRDYRDAEAMLSQPPTQWEPPAPLHKIHDDDIEYATKLRDVLRPWLVKQHDLSLSAAEREALGTADYFRIFHSRISHRYWRELFARTVQRDRGAADWNRLEIYLPNKPKAKEPASRVVSEALAKEFATVESYMKACGNPANPSKTEQRAIWTLALDNYASLVTGGMPGKKAARLVRSFLFAKAPFLAATRDALLKAFNRKREALESSAADPKALRDGREQNGERFDLPDDDRDRLIHRAVFYYRGDVAPAWRDLVKDGFSEPVRRRYFGKAASKSHVPASVMESVSSEVQILTVMHQGPRAFDSIMLVPDPRERQRRHDAPRAARVRFHHGPRGPQL
jgi:hypothetical protein